MLVLARFLTEAGERPPGWGSTGSLAASAATLPPAPAKPLALDERGVAGADPPPDPFLGALSPRSSNAALDETDGGLIAVSPVASAERLPSASSNATGGGTTACSSKITTVLDTLLRSRKAMRESSTYSPSGAVTENCFVTAPPEVPAPLAPRNPGTTQPWLTRNRRPAQPEQPPRDHSARSCHKRCPSTTSSRSPRPPLPPSQTPDRGAEGSCASQQTSSSGRQTPQHTPGTAPPSERAPRGSNPSA